MKIKDVEERVGITRKNIRFYEEQGLLHPQRNRTNGYREYTEEDIERLEQVKLLRALSVPIDEIRRLFDGTLSLSDCMNRHQIHLTHQKREIDLAAEICEMMKADVENIDQLDPQKWMREMSERSQNSGRNRDWYAKVRNVDVIKKKRSAVLAALFMFLIPAFWIGVPLLVYFTTGETLPLGVVITLGILSLLFVVGLVTVLKERLDEIEKGEEDEALKY